MNMKKIIALQIKVFFITLAVIAVLVSGLIGWFLWSFYTWGEPKDLIKAGKSQVELRARIHHSTGIELTENDSIKNAWMWGARDASYCYEVPFDPEKSDQLRKKLLREGFVEVPRLTEDEQEKYDFTIYMQTQVPKHIATWWNAERLEKTTIFNRGEYNACYPTCFLDKEQGILFIKH